MKSREDALFKSWNHAHWNWLTRCFRRCWNTQCTLLDEGSVRVVRCLLSPARSGKSWSDIRFTIQLLTGWLFCPRWMDYCSGALTEPVARHPRLPVCLSVSETGSKAHSCSFALRTRYHFSIYLIPCYSDTRRVIHTKPSLDLSEKAGYVI